MPRDAIEERIADEHSRAKSLTGTAVIPLAVSFGVSTQVMLFRLCNNSGTLIDALVVIHGHEQGWFGEFAKRVPLDRSAR